MLLAPLFSWIWIQLRKRNIEPRTPNKFVLGLAQMAIGYGIIIWGASMFDERAIIPLLFLCLMYLLHTTGELSLSPVGLSVVTKLSPPKVVGFVMGTWFLSIAFAHKVAGALGKLTSSPEAGTEPAEALSAFTSTYWTWGVLVVAGSAVFLLLLSPILKRWMHDIH
jgi:POT family proton-dependent oligopeptide transporter